MPEKLRFYVNGRISGYWGIHDRIEEDNIIWIDCKESYLNYIVKALNSMPLKVVYA